MTPDAVHLNLDDAWPPGVMGLPTRDLRAWGPRLRYTAPPATVDAFVAEVGPSLPKWVLYGSGDFHYLARVFLLSTGQLDRLIREQGEACCGVEIVMAPKPA